MRTRPTLTWEPSGAPLPRTTSLDEVAQVLADGNVAVLSGAGISTESGIPDYRGASGSLRRHTPMTYDEFVSSTDGRRRYWARSHVGWRTIARAQPNDGHHAVAALRARGYLSGVITQNVDGLHTAAGTPDVVELHGNLDRVICLDCRRTSPRDQLDQRFREANPTFEGVAIRVNPDGDVDLDDHAVQTFTLVDCTTCPDGVLKPDVVFFGENVPRPRVEQCYQLVDESDALLVLGSSLTVMSGLRFVRHAAKTGKPVLIVNRGRTRGDEYATVRVDLPLGLALTALTTRLQPERRDQQSQHDAHDRDGADHDPAPPGTGRADQPDGPPGRPAPGGLRTHGSRLHAAGHNPDAGHLDGDEPAADRRGASPLRH